MLMQGFVMSTLKITLGPLGILAAAIVIAQEPPALSRAKALDQEIEKAKDLPDDVRPRAIQDLARRVRRQPEAYLVALAFNLGVSTTDADGHDTLQQVAATLVDALRRSPVENKTDDAYLMLAEFVHYGHVQVSFDDPRFTTAIAQLEADDKYRSEADFTLNDVQGHEWNLKTLRGKVVLVNDGKGRLTGTVGRPSMNGWLGLLGQAGLKQ